MCSNASTSTDEFDVNEECHFDEEHEATQPLEELNLNSDWVDSWVVGKFTLSPITFSKIIFSDSVVIHIVLGNGYGSLLFLLPKTTIPGQAQQWLGHVLTCTRIGVFSLSYLIPYRMYTHVLTMCMHTCPIHVHAYMLVTLAMCTHTCSKSLLSQYCVLSCSWCRMLVSMFIWPVNAYYPIFVTGEVRAYQHYKCIHTRSHIRLIY